MTKKRAILIVGIGLVGATATMAYRQVFARPSDDAFRLVPASARMIIKLELTPTPSQAGQFAHLKSLLDDDDVQKGIESITMFPLSANESVVTALRPHVKRGGVGGWLGSNVDDFYIIAPVDSGAAVEAIIGKGITAEFLRGAKIYKVKSTESYASVMGDYLVMAHTKVALADIKACADGMKPSVSQDETFAALRDQSRESNLAVYFADDGGVKDGKTVSWMMAGLGVQDGGFGINIAGTVHEGRRADFANLLALKPLPKDLLTKLPDHPMMVGAIAQPGEIVAAISGKEDKKSQPNDVDNEDLRQGMDGDVVIAAYPYGENSFDVLMIADDANGGNPEKFVEKLIEAAPKGDEKSPIFVETDGIYSLSPQREKELRKSMAETAEKHASNGLYDHATIAYAKVNGAIVAGSSRDIVARARDRWRNPQPTVLTGLAGLETDVRGGSQVVLSISIADIVGRLGQSIKGEHREDFDKLQATLKSVTRPLSIRLAVNPEGRFVGSAFVPVAFDELAKSLKPTK